MATPIKSALVIDFLRRRGYRVSPAGRFHCLSFPRGGRGWASIRLLGPELWAFARLEGM